MTGPASPLRYADGQPVWPHHWLAVPTDALGTWECPACTALLDVDWYPADADGTDWRELANRLRYGLVDWSMVEAATAAAAERTTVEFVNVYEAVCRRCAVAWHPRLCVVCASPFASPWPLWEFCSDACESRPDGTSRVSEADSVTVAVSVNGRSEQLTGSGLDVRRALVGALADDLPSGCVVELSSSGHWQASIRHDGFLAAGPWLLPAQSSPPIASGTMGAAIRASDRRCLSPSLKPLAPCCCRPSR